MRNGRARIVGVALGVAAGAALIVAAQFEETAATSCEQLRPSPRAEYQPITVGPVIFDPGPALGRGDIKYLAYGAAGYVTKAWVEIDFSGGAVTLRGRHVRTAMRMLFDYPPASSDYIDEIDLRPTELLLLLAEPSSTRPGSWALPGAIAVPELGIYDVTVEGTGGKRWTKRVSICTSASGQPSPRS